MSIFNPDKFVKQAMWVALALTVLVAIFLSKEFLVGWIAFLAYGFYWLDTLIYAKNPSKGSKPNRSSWFMLTVVSGMVCYSYYQVGADFDGTLWTAVGVFVGTSVTFALSIPYGSGTWNDPLDKWCLVIAGLSLVAWGLLSVTDIVSPVWLPTVLFINALLIDFVAILPTIGHAYRSPQEESWFAWGMTVVADVLTLAFVDWAWTLEVFNIAFYPFYMALMNGIVLFFILRPRINTLLNKQHAHL